MISICICDDSLQDLELLRDEIVRYEAQKQVQFNLSLFSSSKALLYELEENNIADIYILDVSMPGKNGFEVAETIRDKSQTAVIIFLTSMEDMAICGYRFRALRYIVKMNLSKEIDEALDSALDELVRSDSRAVTVHRYNDYRKVLHRDIIYVRRTSRQLVIVTDSCGELIDSRGISDFFDLLNDGRFLFVDRGCFVNVDYITQLTGSEIRLKNSEVIQVSRRCMQKVRQLLLERWSL